MNLTTVKEVNKWKASIERDIRKSDEYDTVINNVESVLEKIKIKKSQKSLDKTEKDEVIKVFPVRLPILIIC